MHYHRVAVFWLFIFPVIGLGREFQPPVPKVDERIELLTIVFRFAAAEEFFSQSFPLYTDEIDRHFSSFQDHKAVKYVRDVLRRSGIGQDAVVNFGLHLSLEQGKVTFPDETKQDGLKYLDSRWHPKVARRFARLLDDFYTTTDFHHFFQQHRKTYQLMEERFAKISGTVNYSWFENFYGTKHPGGFDIILMPGFDDGGFAAKCTDKDGIDQIYAFIGTEMINHEGEPFYDAEIHARLIVHEFNHSWCNPIVDKYFLQFEDDIAPVFSSVSQKMSRLSYGTPRIMMYEYFVRLADIAYLKKHFQSPVVREYQQRCKMLGFVLMDDLVPLLDQYENNRDLHPTLDDFAPEIMQNMNRIEQSRPKVVAMDPPNHAKDVDASITQIHVTFDRPMSSAMAWCSADGSTTFPKIVTPAASWSEDQKTCTLAEISLEPDTTYNIWLNLGEHNSFQSVDGMILSDTFYTFTTASDPKNEVNE